MTDYITVTDLAVDLNYETMVATITGKLVETLVLDDGLVDVVEIFPLFSFGDHHWQQCVPAAADQTEGWSASPAGEDFTYYWDFRDIVPSDNSEVTVAVAVTGYYEGLGEEIPEIFGEDPETNFVLVTAGPEQYTPVAEQGATDLTVVEAVQIIEYKLFDRDSQPCNIRMEYSMDGGGDIWNACTEGVGGDGMENLATSPDGTAHTFAWDTLADGVRGVKVLVRVTPYKAARPSPTVHADFRFTDYLIAAWDFGTGGATAPVPAGDKILPEMLYGSTRGNRDDDYDGVVSQETSRLRLECDGGLRAAVGFPRHGITGFADVSRAFMADFRFDIGTAEKIILEIVGANDGRTLVRVTLSTVDDLQIDVLVGSAWYTLTSTGAVYAASTEYNARLTLTPGDDSVTVSLVIDGVPVSFDLPAGPDALLPKIAALFNVPEIFVRASAEGANGTAAFIGRLVLLDDDQFTEAHTPPTADDPRVGEWLAPSWWPRAEDDCFVGNDGDPADYSTLPGQHGRAIAITGDVPIPSATAGKRKWFRPDLFKNGFGIEFHALVPDGILRLSLQDAASNVDLIINFGSGGVSADIVDDAAGTTHVVFQDELDPWVPDTAVWHHFRFSVRKDANWTVAISVDGSQPTYAVMPSAPQLFTPTGGTPQGYQLKLGLVSYVGPDPVRVDDLKAWDGYHMSPYLIPVPEEPQTDYWKP